MPIEKIRVGDRVLSKPEEGGELAYKPVVNTFVSDDKEIWLLDFFCHRDGQLSRLVVTGNHPFWVSNVGWTSALQLLPGDRLELHDGSQASVYRKHKVFSTDVKNVGWCNLHDSDEYGPKIDLRDGSLIISTQEEEVSFKDVGDPTTFILERVYNIEVEGFHTYYVGEQGVWVHNVDCANPEGGAEKAKSGVNPSTAITV